MDKTNPKVETILAEAVEITSEPDCQTYVEKACAGNAVLRAQVERLMTNHFRAGAFLERPVALLETIVVPSVTEGLGTRIGPYKLHEQIGEGGFGVVFMAEQQEPIRRKVAIKIVKPGMDSRQVIARFEAERQALALMDHPNIAKVLDAGQTPSGRPYFVMELVKGLPITEFCDHSRLTSKERLNLFIDVCRAVQHAHQKAIIHRDIKPSNVLVTLQDGEPLVQVIDFGISKALGQQLTDKTLLTGFAQTIGTPLYMAPEQTALSNADVDTRSDIYSLGVLLYELLTGTTPFEKERLHAASYDEMRRIIREEEPPKPSTRLSTLEKGALSTVCEHRSADPRKLGEQVRGELDWIVMKALEKDRRRRYESASALAADVQRYLKDEPVEACPPSVVYRFRKYARRHRAWLGVAAILGLALLSGLGLLWGQERQRAATELAVAKDLEEADLWQKQEQWGKALQALERAKGRLAENSISQLFAQVEERRREVAFAIRLNEAQLKASSAASDTGPQTADLFEAALANGGRQVRNFDYAAADKAYSEAFSERGLDMAVLAPEEIAERIRKSALAETLVAALDFWAFFKDCMPVRNGDALRVIARLADNDPWRNQLRDLQITNDPKVLERMAVSESVLRQSPANLLFLGYLLEKANAHAAAVRLLRQAQERHPSSFWINLELAYQLDRDSNHMEAAGYFRVALALQPQSSTVYNDLKKCLEKMPEAIDRKAIAVNPENAAAQERLGRFLHQEKRFAEAEDPLIKLTQLKPKYAAAFEILGWTLVNQGKGADGEIAFREALKLGRRTENVYMGLGVGLRNQLKFSEGAASSRRALESNPFNEGTLFQFAQSVCFQQKLPQSEALFRKMVSRNPRKSDWHNWLGQVLYLQGRISEAAEAAKKAIQFDDAGRAYSTLSWALRAQGKVFEADAARRKAEEFNGGMAAWNDGWLFMGQGQNAEAVASFKRASELGCMYGIGSLECRQAELYSRLEDKLPTILTGHAVPADPSECLALAHFCQLPTRKYFATSARLHAEAFDADPNSVGEIRAEIRYGAASAAAQAGCGQGMDAIKPDAGKCARLREQAAAWLRADLSGWHTEMKTGTKSSRSGVIYEMEWWQQDPALACVRGADALAKLPETERQEWEKLWEEVAELEKRAAASTLPLGTTRH